MEKVKGKIFDIKLFSKLLVFVMPYNNIFYGVMFTAILISLFSTLTPYLLKVVVDDYILVKNYEGMQSIILLMMFGHGKGREQEHQYLIQMAL